MNSYLFRFLLGLFGGRRGGDLVLLEIQPKVYEVFQLLGFSQFFNIKDNLNDAVDFFNQKGQAGSSVGRMR